jgi:hypothetical protein
VRASLLSRPLVSLYPMKIILNIAIVALFLCSDGIGKVHAQAVADTKKSANPNSEFWANLPSDAGEKIGGAFAQIMAQGPYWKKIESNAIEIRRVLRAEGKGSLEIDDHLHEILFESIFDKEANRRAAEIQRDLRTIVEIVIQSKRGTSAVWARTRVAESYFKLVKDLKYAEAPLAIFMRVLDPDKNV